MNVPLLDLHQQSAALRDDILAAFTRVYASQQFIMGPDVGLLEQELSAALEVPHAVAVSSGTDALLVSLMALGIGPGDEVITPTFSFFATAGCVSRVGATPVLVDIDPVTFNIDPAVVQRALTPRTRAVIPVHLFGLCADIDALRAVLPSDVAIIEDSAQGIGATVGRRQAGSLGDLACFSFFPSKNLGAFGDAGLVTTRDDKLAARVRLLRTHGEAAKSHHVEVGGNFRMDSLQAAFLRVKLPHLSGWNERRRANAETYRRLFAEAGLATVVGVPAEPTGYRHVYHQYVVRVPRRDALREHLTAAGIGSAIYYPVPFHRQACFAALPSASERFPHADAAAESVLALPIFPELTLDQQKAVVDAITGFYR